MNLIKSSGLLLLLVYAAFNMLNILYFYQTVSTIYWLIAIAMLYFPVRLIVGVKRKLFISQSECFGIALLFLLICTVLAQNLFLQSYVGLDSVNTTENINAITMISVLWFFVGGACAQFDFKESFLASIVISLGVAMLMFFGANENLTIDYSAIRVESGIERVSHLTLEKHVVLLLVFAYAISAKARFLTLPVALVALFFMGGRTALFVFIIAALLMNFKGNLLRNSFITIVIAMIGATLFWFGVTENYIDVDSKAVREILLLDGVEDDSSYAARVELLEGSFGLLADQFWIGNFALVSKTLGGVNSYVHNILSAWQFYGFFVFVSLLAILILVTRRMVFFVKEFDQPIDIFGAFLLLYVIISVFISKYVGWHLLWFVLGFWLLRIPPKMPSRKRKKRKKTKKQSTGLMSSPVV